VRGLVDYDRLSPTQRRAYERLAALEAATSEPWHCSYGLRESLSTLRSLVKRGLVEMRGDAALGSSWTPRTLIEFRIKGSRKETQSE